MNMKQFFMDLNWLQSWLVSGRKAIQLSLGKTEKVFFWKIEEKAAKTLTMILAHSSIYLYSGGGG